MGDYNNLKSIFHHKFGLKTAYDGYINKYFSIKPFEFDNKAAMMELSKKLFSIEIRNSDLAFFPQLFKRVINDLIRTEALKLRELTKLVVNYDATESIVESAQLYDEARLPLFYLIFHLTKISDIDSIIGKLNDTRMIISAESSKSFNYDGVAKIGLMGLISNPNSSYWADESKEYSINYENSSYTLRVKRNWVPSIGVEYLDIESVKLTEGGNIGTPPFGIKDFYEILYLNACVFKTIQNKKITAVSKSY